ncbi:MAG: proton-conducting transporter membrane subunit [Deltaproteobacteria bacterium]|nr:proton-conducting transporter membrane subunit [Deltaproteobacteria bacterium]
MTSLAAFTLFAVPLLPFVAGCLPRLLRAKSAVSLTIAAALSACVAAIVSAVLLTTHGHITTLGAGPNLHGAWAVSLRLDEVSAVMLVLVSFVGASVMSFSRNHLGNDAEAPRFFSWLSNTLAAVLLLVSAGHLLLLWVAWVATSLCLHQLLLFYPTRAGAVFSARKKFVISRMGDLCLLAAIVLLQEQYNTFDVTQMFAAVDAGQTQGLSLPCALIAACAALKSAQFPFHGWLPDTMETPTPVSAFMHAGIINAGGFLVIRLSPLFVHAPHVLSVLALVGAVTAGFGAVVMLAQPSVKRALAYSTIAQMGFMLLQCGLGAFALATVHIVAHSLYKAHAFLTAGSTIGAVPRKAAPLRTGALVLGLATAAATFVAHTTALNTLGAHLELGVLGLVFVLAMGYGLARLWSVQPKAVLLGLATTQVFCLLGLGLHAGAQRFFVHTPHLTPSTTVITVVGALFAGLFLFQTLLWRMGHRKLGQRLYVHALNGFYVGTLGNRLLGRLWPPQHSNAQPPLPVAVA